MRDLVHFDIRPNGRIGIASVPPVGSEVIFSETFVRERAAVDVPGIMADLGNWPLPINTIITLTPTNPQNAPALTFRVDRIGPYDPPAYGNIVVFATRLT